MANEYKDQLVLNLMEYYKGRGFTFLKHYDSRDEILIIIPADEAVRPIYDQLYEVLESLPTIDLPWERTMISYSHAKWQDHYYKIINPTETDIKNANMVAMGAGHYITVEEYKQLK